MVTFFLLVFLIFPGLSLLDMESEIAKHVSQKTTLGRQISEYLVAGKDIPMDIYQDILENFATQESILQNKPITSILGGWVLDGFPNTRAEAELLLEIGLMPDFLIDLRDGKLPVIFKESKKYRI
jgi:adenylate kinase family enzyme